MKRQLFIVDGEFKSFEGCVSYIEYTPRPGCTPSMLVKTATPTEQAAYEFGRQEKAEEILEALSREFFGEKKP